MTASRSGEPRWFIFTNHQTAALRLQFEPKGEEFRIPAGATIEAECIVLDPKVPLQFEVVPEGVVVWADPKNVWQVEPNDSRRVVWHDGGAPQAT